MNEAATIPTWGYRSDGSAEIFDLAPGESLPEGWHGTPDIIADPALRTAEAVSTAAARAAETNRLPTAPPSAPETGAKGAKVSHPSRAPDRAEALRAENARLVAEVDELRQGLAAAQAAHDAALARAEALAAQITASPVPAAPTEQGPDDGGEGPAADTAAPGSPPARTRDEARDAVRALLVEDLTDREIARRVGVSPSTVAAVRRAAGA